VTDQRSGRAANPSKPRKVPDSIIVPRECEVDAPRWRRRPPPRGTKTSPCAAGFAAAPQSGGRSPAWHQVRAACIPTDSTSPCPSVAVCALTSAPIERRRTGNAGAPGSGTTGVHRAMRGDRRFGDGSRAAIEVPPNSGPVPSRESCPFCTCMCSCAGTCSS
jgi:hypothetical protein